MFASIIAVPDATVFLAAPMMEARACIAASAVVITAIGASDASAVAAFAVP
jgi:hypothetical protein